MPNIPSFSYSLLRLIANSKLPPARPPLILKIPSPDVDRNHGKLLSKATKKTLNLTITYSLNPGSYSRSSP